jgi:3-hydroxyisobutyrate dehydrogenase
MSSIGFIGLGQMGAALATRLLTTLGRTPLVAADPGATQPDQPESSLMVFDLDPERVAELTRRGAAAAASVAEIAKSCSTVILCLPTSQLVRSVLMGPAGIAADLGPGALIIDCTTGEPGVTRELSAELGSRGIGFVDAPVSGGPQAATAGTIAIMVGGTDEAVAQARPVLELISPNVRSVGGSGAGHCVKLLNNALAAAHRMMAFETATLAALNGVDPKTFIEVVNLASGRSYATEITMPRHIFGEQLVQGFSLGLMAKDVGLAGALVPPALGDISVISVVNERLQSALGALPPSADINETITLYERASGREVATSERPVPG